MSALRRAIPTFFLLLCGMTAVRGQEIRLRAAVAVPEGFVAAGSVFARLDAAGELLQIRPLDEPLTALAALDDGRLFALDGAGEVLLSLDAGGAVLSRSALPVRGRLRALSSDGGRLWAVTDAGEILYSQDGAAWTVLDFNAQYAGFYPAMDFRAVAAGGGSVMVAGLTADGRPAAFSSGRGTVWSERTLDHTEQGGTYLLEAVPSALSYDPLRDAFQLLCSDGVQLTLPGCSHCNSLKRYPVDTLYARVSSGFDALLLGSGGFRILEKP